MISISKFYQVLLFSIRGSTFWKWYKDYYILVELLQNNQRFNKLQIISTEIKLQSLL